MSPMSKPQSSLQSTSMKTECDSIDIAELDYLGSGALLDHLVGHASAAPGTEPYGWVRKNVKSLPRTPAGSDSQQTAARVFAPFACASGRTTT